MMKWTFAINAGLGAVLVAASVGSGQSGDGGLEVTLKRTVHGLEELVGIQKRLETGDTTAVSELVRVTDPAGADSAEDEARLTALRLEVARLRMIHDGLAPADSVGGASNSPAGSSTHAGSGTTPRAAGDSRAAAPKKGDKNTKAPTTVDETLTAFEPAGFSVDPVLQGEAYFRAGRYEDCLSTLRKAPDDPRGQYWTARTLELMGRVDEALETYRKLAARKDGGWAADRAKSDLEFLEWKRSSAPRTETDTKSTPAKSNAPTQRSLVPSKGPSQP